MLLISQAILLLCALLLAGRSYKIGETLNLTSAMVVSLAAAFIAAATCSELLLQGSDQDTLTLQRMLNNLAFYAGIPLISSALIDYSWKFDWSRAAWGRWLLVLFALFELLRRAELGELYSQILAISCLLALLASALKLNSIREKIWVLTGSGFTGLSLLLFSDTSLLVEWRSAEMFNLFLAGGMISLAFFYPRSKSESA